MLTIRVIHPDGGELVKEVSSVMRRPGSETATQSACVTYWDGEKAVDIFDATVYVMNENGKTIADYVVSKLWTEPVLTGEGSG